MQRLQGEKLVRIEKIVLKNYRQYRDQVIDFGSAKTGKHFIVIEGGNGAGKTNLLNAITWCLYGKEADIGDKSKGKPIINDITLERMGKNEFEKVCVEIHMRDNEGKKIIFRRQAVFDKKSKIVPDATPSRSVAGTRFEIMQQIGPNMVNVPDPTYKVNKIVPEAINEYFFFNGEKLNEYFKAPLSEKIKEEVFNISQLDLFEEVVKHLSTMNTSFSRDLRKIHPKADELGKLLELKRKELNAEGEDLKKVKREKNAAAELIKDLENKLRTSSSTVIKNLQIERENLENDISDLERESEYLGKEQLDYFIRIMFIIMGHQAISRTNEILQKKIKRGEIPPDYKKRFVKGLLEDGRCICGADISEKSSATRNRVEILLEKCEDITEISVELMEQRDRTENMLKELKTFRDKQTKDSKDLKDRKDKIEQKNKRLKEIHEQIKHVDIGQIERYERELENLKQKKEDIIQDITIKEGIMKSLENEISVLEKNYKDELAGIEKRDDLRKVLLFCEDALEAAGKIKNEIMQEVRNQIKEKTKKQFFELIWKKDSFKDVKINRDYNISVVDNRGMEAVGTLSAGERQVLALAFMSALNKVSGFDVPIIIDTPLARIAGEPRENIARNLPYYLMGKQVLLLVTEDEYTKNVREKIRKAVGKEYLIKFRETEEGGEAEVVAYEG